MKRIFFVEDDLSLINGLTFAVRKQGYEIDVARTSLEAKRLWADGKYDLVILDVSLPDGSGFDICTKIRQTSKVPIMFLTAADEETDIIMGLDIGADDYITKPFKLAVFLSRINALLRRSDNFSRTDQELSSNGIMQSEAGANDSAAIKEFTDLSEQELDRIETLVQNLLKITKFDAGSVVMEKRTENIFEMMEDVKKHFAFRAEQEGKEIVLSGWGCHSPNP